jgi:hypothetical protein
MLIERATGREFLKDHEITDLKPQNLTAPTITMDVPSSTVAPHTTRTNSAPPTSGHFSSSPGGVLRLLKSILAWWRDTHQHQDILLSNQTRQNEKMGINEFSLLVPPLDDDSFASLSIADIAAMEAAPAAAADGFGSEYEE